MNLTQELVELPAADLREPVIEAGKKRKDRAKRQHIMEVGNHIIGVVQIVVDTTVGQYHAGNAAAREEENETDRERKSVVEGKSVSVRVDPGGRPVIKKKKRKED